MGQKRQPYPHQGLLPQVYRDPARLSLKTRGRDEKSGHLADTLDLHRRTNVNLNILSLHKGNSSNNGLYFVTEIQNAQKRFVFYTKFLIESLCYKNITVNN